jgi:hypothetical protein
MMPLLPIIPILTMWRFFSGFVYQKFNLSSKFLGGGIQDEEMNGYYEKVIRKIHVTSWMP